MLAAMLSGATPAHGSLFQDPAPAQVASTAPMTTADLVAPVALYPDQLLGQVLTISTTPQEVLDLGTWLVDNDSLKGSKAEAAKAAGFSTSAQYLAMFPQVVDNMCQQIDWTTQLGDAYTDDAKKVMAGIQSKRAEAVKAGNLKTSSQMTVTNKKGDDGKSYIEITPTDPQVIYVPTYNPITVYVQSAPAPATVNTTVVVQQQQSGVSSGAAVGIGLLSFGVGMAVGASINNSYYPYPAWGYGGMYYGGRPYYPPPYRPPYYPGYHPAYGYHPPANYHWNQVNRQTNITVNNNNYYNRVNNNSNNVNRGNNASRPGQISQSNRPGAANNRPGGAGNSNRPGGAGNNTRPGGNDRGYAGGGPGGSGAATQRPTNNASRPSPAASRPAATARPSTQAARPSPQARPQQSGGAFGGTGGGSGSSARAASSRGHASAGPSRGGGGGGGGGGRRR
jgi:hypothetical protein